MRRNFIPSVFVVSGCSMGAGILALPIITAGSNFIISSIFLCLTAIFSYFLATISLNVYVKHKNGINTATIVGMSFGHSGKIFSMIINGLLMYALLTVYITGGANLFDKTVFPLIPMPALQHKGLLTFLILFLPVFLWGKNIVVQSNKFVFYLKLFAFIFALILGLGFLNIRILEFIPSQIRYIPTAIPVLFGCLAFQMVVPVIAEINAYNTNEIKKILRTGILLPLALYIGWIGIMLSLIPRTGAHSFSQLIINKESVGTMMVYATQYNPLPTLMKTALNVFSNVALLTSFLTIGLALYEYLRDSFKIRQGIKGKIITLSITMLPPILIATLYPDGFVLIYQQAMILLVISFILPIAACIQQYDKLDYTAGSKKYLYLILLISLGIIVLQVLDNFKLLPNFPYN